jgi:hypothetical protein
MAFFLILAREYVNGESIKTPNALFKSDLQVDAGVYGICTVTKPRT